MSVFTYPVIVKPFQDNRGNLGIEYWFPDFEECEHIFFEDITDEGVAIDAKQHLFALIAGKEARCEPLPTPKWYGAEAYPRNAQLRFLTVDINARSGYFSEKGEESMNVSYDSLSGSVDARSKSADDTVNHPQHYTRSGIECIDAIDSLTGGYERPGHAYYAGQVLKYLWRAPFKGHYLQDLEKAQWYLNRLVKKVQDEADHGN